ncbi:hypothetical protein GCM10022254_03240 [Actinomadura meridiana]|uniref:Uncharacterized protein n=1 Tax=Actinomadura meridiana TaxID=559626 RepID=A0ABP8BSX9_9ACTN
MHRERAQSIGDHFAIPLEAQLTLHTQPAVSGWQMVNEDPDEDTWLEFHPEGEVDPVHVGPELHMPFTPNHFSGVFNVTMPHGGRIPSGTRTFRGDSVAAMLCQGHRHFPGDSVALGVDSEEMVVQYGQMSHDQCTEITVAALEPPKGEFLMQNQLRKRLLR